MTQNISDKDLAHHEDIVMDGGADGSYVQAIVDDLRAARRTIALISLRNGIDMGGAGENEFELGIRHSATFIQEILDDEMTSDEEDQLIATASAMGAELSEVLVPRA